jgi:hypothetical protein
LRRDHRKIPEHGEQNARYGIADRESDVPERGLYGVFYSKIGGCDNPNFHDADLAIALVDKWIIE